MAALRRLHGRLLPGLELPRDRLGPWLFWALLLLVVVVGALLRLRLLFDGLSPDELMNGQPFLTSSDGFYFATGVGHLVSDAWGSSNPRVPLPESHALVAIAAFIVDVFGAQREVVFSWMPVVIGPLVAVPMALIGRAYQRSVLGLVAALGLVVMPAYRVRTSMAYFDTDMFSLTVPLVAVLFMVRLFREVPKDPCAALAGTARRDALLGALSLATYVWWYDQGVSLTHMLSIPAAIGLGMVALMSRSSPLDPTTSVSVGAPESSRHALLIAIATLPIFWGARALAVIAAHAVLARVTVQRKTLAIVAVLATLTAIVLNPALHQVINKITTYADNTPPREAAPGDALLVDDAGQGIAAAPSVVPNDASSGPSTTGSDAPAPPPTKWQTQDTTSVVAEVRVLTLDRMTELLAGHWLIALIGGLGFLLFLVWRPGTFLLLPISAIGVFAFIGGHRFLMYLGPAVYFGVAYLAARLPRALPPAWRLTTTAALGIAAALPAVLSADRGEQLQVTFSQADAAPLLALSDIASNTDTVISWWDFGYPIAYYAKTRTIADGSRRGDDAALVAEILFTESAELASKLARLCADAAIPFQGEGAAWALVNRSESMGLDPDAFLAAVMAGTFPTYPRSGDVYVYLTRRLLPILPVLEATRPLTPGQTRRAPYLRVYRGVRSEGATLYLERGLQVDADKVQLSGDDGFGVIGRKNLREVRVISGSGPTQTTRSRMGDPRAETIGILLLDERMFLELDPRILQTQWAKLYLLEDFDPRYYEPVILTPSAKIYRYK